MKTIIEVIVAAACFAAVTAALIALVRAMKLVRELKKSGNDHLPKPEPNTAGRIQPAPES